MQRYILGLDIGGTNIRAGFLDETYAVVHFEKASSREVFNGGMDGLCRYIQRLVASTGLRPSCVSAGFPATLDTAHRRILSTPNLPGMNDVPAADILEEKTGLPVFLDKDTNLLLPHNVRFMRLQTAGRLIAGIYAGTGIGNAIMYDGRILEGKNGAAGELGHIPLPGQTALCGCGRRGCGEAVCGGAALEALGARYFPDTPVGQIFTRHREDARIEYWLDTLACVIAAEIVILDPHHILLGGGLPFMPDFPVNRLLDRVFSHTRISVPRDGIDIRLADRTDADRQGVIGACIYARQQPTRE